MIFLNFGSDDAEGGLDEGWEVFKTKSSSVNLKSLVILEVLCLVVNHPRRLLIFLLSARLTKQRKWRNLCSRFWRWVTLRRLTRCRWKKLVEEWWLEQTVEEQQIADAEVGEVDGWSKVEKFVEFEDVEFQARMEVLDKAEVHAESAVFSSFSLTEP